MAAKIPLDRYGESFAKYVAGVKSAYLKPYRDEIRAMRNESSESLLKTTLGRALWGKGNPERPPSGTPRFLVGAPRVRFSKSQNVFLGGFKILGMAALMVKGGRTEGHLIKPKGKFLAFENRGKDIFAQGVHHPGSKVRSVDVIQRILEKRAAKFRPEAVRILDELARDSFR